MPRDTGGWLRQVLPDGCAAAAPGTSTRPSRTSPPPAAARLPPVRSSIAKPLMPSPCPQQALFSEDFYFKYGLRPTPAEVLQSPFLPPLADLPFSPVQRRYTGYQKYAPRVVAGVEAYAGELREAVAEGQWGAVASLLEKGSKGRGSNTKGEGTGKPAAPLRASCRAFGLFANTVLQSENDGGTTTANLLARHLINELYFSMDDMAEAAAAADQVNKSWLQWVGGSIPLHKSASASGDQSLQLWVGGHGRERRLPQTTVGLYSRVSVPEGFQRAALPPCLCLLPLCSPAPTPSVAATCPHEMACCRHAVTMAGRVCPTQPALTLRFGCHGCACRRPPRRLGRGGRTTSMATSTSSTSQSPPRWGIDLGR